MRQDMIRQRFEHKECEINHEIVMVTVREMHHFLYVFILITKTRRKQKRSHCGPRAKVWAPKLVWTQSTDVFHAESPCFPPT